jgi:hypothetical protein
VWIAEVGRRVVAEGGNNVVEGNAWLAVLWKRVVAGLSLL